jgi:hypothetical protein
MGIEGAAMNTVNAMKRPIRLVELACILGMAAAAALSYARFFSGDGFVVPLLLASVLGGVVAVVTDSRGLRWQAIVLWELAAAAIYIVFVLYLHHGVSAPIDAGSGVVNGWAHMLSVGVPADPTADLLITPVLISWAAGATAMLAVLRSRSMLLPILPFLLAFVTGLLFSAAQPNTNWLAVGVFVVSAFSFLVVRGSELEQATPRADMTSLEADRAVARNDRALGKALLAIPLVVALGLAGVAVAGALSIANTAHRFDLRTLRHPPVKVTDTLNPVALVDGQYALKQPANVFKVSFKGSAPRPRYIRLATLQDYDGSEWTTNDSYLPAGRRLATIRTTVMPEVDREAFTLSAPSTYLPVAGRALGIDASGVAYDVKAGALVATRPNPAYTVTADVAVPDQRTLRTAKPDANPALLSVPLKTHLKKDYLDEANALTRGAAGERMFEQIQSAMLKIRVADASQQDGAPGSSEGRLLEFQSDGAGTSEQIATKFALLARLLGFDSRIAVGYRVPDDQTGSDVTITTADAHVWPEVRFAGIGWVDFEPTSKNVSSANVPQTTTTTLPAGQKAAVDETQRQVSSTGTGKALHAPHHTSAAARGFEIIVLLAVLLVVCAVGVVFAKSQRRRRRRNASTPAKRVIGAWNEVTDRLVEHGIAVTPSLTSEEVVERADGHIPESSRVAIASMPPLVSVALFAPFEPPDVAVDRAWKLEASVRTGLEQSRSLPVRLRSIIDPRPLFRGARLPRLGKRRSGS